MIHISIKFSNIKGKQVAKCGMLVKADSTLGQLVWVQLCCTMACFERDLHTLISGGDHVALALYRSYL